ncbi:MAG: site-specific DNA-methyltransferase [Pseudomonadota bacterium]
MGEYISRLVEVFEEVRRVLRSDGCCFINVGDSYCGGGHGPTGNGSILGRNGEIDSVDYEKRQGFVNRRTNPPGQSIKAKDLLLVPERLALAFQGFSAVPGAALMQMADELVEARQAQDWLRVEAVESQLRVWARMSAVFAPWWVRSRICWAKTSAMPESCQDRPTSAWEHIWMLSKSATYYWDADAVREETSYPPGFAMQSRGKAERDGVTKTDGLLRQDIGRIIAGNPLGRNLRNFWLLGPEPQKSNGNGTNHYAAYPTEIPRRCILASTPEAGACARCGTPWRRVTEKWASKPDRYQRGDSALDVPGSPMHRNGSGQGGLLKHADFGARTLGWTPGCSCRLTETVAATVLDPFVGSGTTLVVARELGRHGVGIDLSEDYCKLAIKRIEAQTPSLLAPGVMAETAEQLTLEVPA